MLTDKQAVAGHEPRDKQPPQDRPGQGDSMGPGCLFFRVTAKSG